MFGVSNYKGSRVHEYIFDVYQYHINHVFVINQTPTLVSVNSNESTYLHIHLLALYKNACLQMSYGASCYS